MFSQFTPGDRVHVSNNQPEPPKHHTNKLRAWRAHNYDGVVADVDERSIAIHPHGHTHYAFQYDAEHHAHITVTKLD